MASRGATSRDLAVSLQTTESTVSRWRNGIKPSPLNRRRIIRKLKLTEQEIADLGWAEEAVRV